MSTLNRKNEFALIDELAGEGDRCDGCGCTDNRACIGADGQPCHWVAPGLCSVCADTIAAAQASQRVEVYSPHEAQQFIEQRRAMSAGGGA